jgi:hypothetical protein
MGGKWKKGVCWKCGKTEFESYLRKNTSELCRRCTTGIETPEDRAMKERKPFEELTLTEQIKRQAADEAERVIVQKAIEDRKYADAFEARLDKVANPAAMCQCCMAGANTSKGEHHEELIDPDTSESRYFCRLCTYTISRTGSCAIHRTTPFPKIAATVPQMKIRDIPRDVLYPLTYEFFE